MNFSYEHVRERTIYEQYSQDSYGPNGTPYYSIDEGYGEYWYHLLCYTPQLDIQYKNGFDLKGGEMIQAGLQEPSGAHKAFFFVSGSLDLLRMVDEKRDSGLLVFGSYSQRAASPAIGYQLADLTYGYTNEGLFGNSTGTTGINGNGFIYNEYPPASQRWWVWEAGLRYTGLKGRLQVQGTVERRNYTPQAVVYEPVGSGFSLGSIYPVTTALLLHLDVRATILRGAAGDWEMGINGTVLRSKVDGFTSANADGSLIGYAGDVYPNPYSVTGGWVNRVRVRHFIGGLDLLYHFGETYYETGVGVFPAVTRKLNSVAVPNIYAGYRFGPAHSEVEVFVESRGAIRDSPNDVTDGRRYYTLGGKLSI
jgi:hypothetical protein